MSDTISTYLMFSRQPEEPLQTVLSGVVDAGWELQTRYDGMYKYLVDDEAVRSETLDAVLSDLSGAERASIKVQRDDVEVRLERNTESLHESDVDNYLIWADKYQFTHGGRGRSRETARQNVIRYLDLVQLVVETVVPDYGFGKYGRAVSPVTIPSEDDLNDQRAVHTFWLNIFAPRAVDRFGIEYLLDAPAWSVRELETGHVMVITLDNPIEPSDDWSTAHSDLAEYLGLEFDPAEQ